MDKRSKIALYIIGAVIVFMMIAEVTKPKALNWRDSFSAADKIPLGCFVLFNELETFSEGDVLVSEKSIYEYLKTADSYIMYAQLKGPSHKTNILIIDREHF